MCHGLCMGFKRCKIPRYSRPVTWSTRSQLLTFTQMSYYLDLITCLYISAMYVLEMTHTFNIDSKGVSTGCRPMRILNTSCGWEKMRSAMSLSKALIASSISCLLPSLQGHCITM